MWGKIIKVYGCYLSNMAALVQFDVTHDNAPNPAGSIIVRAYAIHKRTLLSNGKIIYKRCAPVTGMKGTLHVWSSGIKLFYQFEIKE